MTDKLIEILLPILMFVVIAGSVAMTAWVIVVVVTGWWRGRKKKQPDLWGKGQFELLELRPGYYERVPVWKCHKCGKVAIGKECSPAHHKCSKD